jgi:hypothetical protein
VGKKPLKHITIVQTGRYSWLGSFSVRKLSSGKRIKRNVNNCGGEAVWSGCCYWHLLHGH